MHIMYFGQYLVTTSCGDVNKCLYTLQGTSDGLKHDSTKDYLGEPASLGLLNKHGRGVRYRIVSDPKQAQHWKVSPHMDDSFPTAAYMDSRHTPAPAPSISLPHCTTLFLPQELHLAGRYGKELESPVSS